jgi:hypothetical protein
MSNVQTKWTPSERVADVALNRRIAIGKSLRAVRSLQQAAELRIGGIHSTEGSLAPRAEPCSMLGIFFAG